MLTLSGPLTRPVLSSSLVSYPHSSCHFKAKIPVQPVEDILVLAPKACGIRPGEKQHDSDQPHWQHSAAIQEVIFRNYLLIMLFLQNHRIVSVEKDL